MCDKHCMSIPSSITVDVSGTIRSIDGSIRADLMNVPNLIASYDEGKLGDVEMKNSLRAISNMIASKDQFLKAVMILQRLGNTSSY